MSELPDITAANERYAAGFTTRDLPTPPRRKLAILVCMDSRIDTFDALGLALGDAHIIRNAGGRASEDALRSLIISYRILGTREFLVIHHTDCGLAKASNEHIHALLAEHPGVDASSIDFLPFDDLEQSVRDDVQAIRSSPLIPDEIPVTGFVFDVHTGRLSQVE